jgi:hypothetical protein
MFEKAKSIFRVVLFASLLARRRAQTQADGSKDIDAMRFTSHVEKMSPSLKTRVPSASPGSGR